MLGSGTQSNPYIVSTPQDLHDIRNNLSAYYELANDIDMSSWGNFTSIGKTSPYFRGHIDGKGFKIKNLTINESTANVGFIALLDNGGTVNNLAIENGNVRANSVNYSGILIGNIINGTVRNCYTTGEVYGQYGVGGLVGWSSGGLIEDCFSFATPTGTGRVGGLLGNGANSNAKVNKCYSNGLVTVTPDPNLFNGGLIGSHSGQSVVTNSYYDNQTSGQTISAGGIGKSTIEMKTQSTYVNWDFTSIWGIDTDYPYLQVFGVPSLPAKDETVNVISSVQMVVSDSNIKKLSTKLSNTFIDSLVASYKYDMFVFRSVSSNVSKINTTVIQSDKVVKKRTVELDSYLYPVSATVERKSNTYRMLLAHLKPISSEISVLYPLNDKLVIASMNVLKNNSYTVYEQGRSNSFYIENPSFMEVKE